VFKKFHKRSTAGLVALVIAVLVGAGAYAFTAGNKVADHYAGAGSAKVSGYTVSNVAYNDSFQTDGSSEVDGVSFTLDNAATAVKVALMTDGSTPQASDLTACTSSNTTDWSCDFSGSPVVNDQSNPDAQRLFIVANDGGATISLP
jgi:hypothetical protein